MFYLWLYPLHTDISFFKRIPLSEFPNYLRSGDSVHHRLCLGAAHDSETSKSGIRAANS